MQELQVPAALKGRRVAHERAACTTQTDHDAEAQRISHKTSLPEITDHVAFYARRKLRDDPR